MPAPDRAAACTASEVLVIIAARKRSETEAKPARVKVQFNGLGNTLKPINGQSLNCSGTCGNPPEKKPGATANHSSNGAINAALWLESVRRPIRIATSTPSATISTR